MIKNKVIVFGCNHQNMLGLVRSLGEKGIRPYCVLLKSRDGMVYRSKYPAECHYAESPQEGYDYIVKQYTREDLKPILLSSDDMTETLFDRNATELKKHFIVPAADEDGKLTFLMNKQNIGGYASQFGFKTPLMTVVTKEEGIPSDISFPVFTKSVKSIDGGKREEKKCNSKEELQEVLDNCKSDGLLVQQFIDKTDEIDFIGYTANEEVFIPYIQHQMRFSDHAYGGYHRFDKVTENDLFDRIKKMILSIRFQGLFSVEFLVDKNGDWYFTEVNFRHDGHTYLVTASGVNLPYMYCCAVTGEKQEFHPSAIRDTFTGMNEMVDIGQFVSTRKISPTKWFWQFLTADTHIFWNWQDLGPVKYLIRRKK